MLPTWCRKSLNSSQSGADVRSIAPVFVEGIEELSFPRYPISSCFGPFIGWAVGWGQSWLFGKPAVSGFSEKKTAVSGFPAGFLGYHLRLRIALITYI